MKGNRPTELELSDERKEEQENELTDDREDDRSEGGRGEGLREGRRNQKVEVESEENIDREMRDDNKSLGIKGFMGTFVLKKTFGGSWDGDLEIPIKVF